MKGALKAAFKWSQSRFFACARVFVCVCILFFSGVPSSQSSRLHGSQLACLGGGSLQWTQYSPHRPVASPFGSQERRRRGGVDKRPVPSWNFRGRRLGERLWKRNAPHFIHIQVWLKIGEPGPTAGFGLFHLPRCHFGYKIIELQPSDSLRFGFRNHAVVVSLLLEIIRGGRIFTRQQNWEGGAPKNKADTVRAATSDSSARRRTATAACRWAGCLVPLPNDSRIFLVSPTCQSLGIGVMGVCHFGVTDTSTTATINHCFSFALPLAIRVKRCLMTTGVLRSIWLHVGTETSVW